MFIAVTLATHSTPLCVITISLKGNLDMNLLSKFFKDESGATAIEYGLIAAGISVAIITTVNLLGSTLDGTFSFVNTEMNTQ